MNLKNLLLAVSLMLIATPSFAQAPRVQNALDYLTQEASSLGLVAADIADVSVTDAYTSRRSGATHVYLRQRVGGIEVVGSEMTVNVGRNGRVFHTAGQMISGLGSRIAPQKPSLSALSAVGTAASLVGIRSMPTLRQSEVSLGADQATKFSLNGLDDNPVLAKLVYKQDAIGVYHLSWEVVLALSTQTAYWQVHVDARTGEEVARLNLTIEESVVSPAENGALSAAADSFYPFEPAEHAMAALAPFVTESQYRAFALPVESPNHSTPPAPADGRTLNLAPEDATASPFGWHDTNGAAGAEFTDTRGNNVDAHKSGVRPDCGASLHCDFLADFSMSPINYVPAATANNFYLTNVTHDIMYQYGFDEASGNFQENNYGNGGLGSDGVNALVQAPGNCNATMGTPPDGSNPTMSMFLCNIGNPDTDSDFDEGVLVHEFTHGTSNRLTGGPANVGCLSNQEQGGEGWSDWYGIILSMEAGDAGPDVRGVGTYFLGQPTNGPGVRPQPYSTNFGVNNVTYANLPTQVIPHGVGWVWASMLWQATWEVVNAYGYNPDFYDASDSAGNIVMLNLVTEGMKLQPCSPGFVDARNAILAADAALYGGIHTDLLWAGFAARGLGFSASQGSPFSITDGTAAFDVPPPPGGTLDLSCTPVNPTIIIPPTGGTYMYDIRVDNNTGVSQTFDLWFPILGPSGSHVGGPFTRTLAPGGSFLKTVTQKVPGGAAAGAYKHTCNVGTFPGTILDTDLFSWTKAAPFAPGSELAGELIADWSTDAEIEAELGSADPAIESASRVGVPETAELMGAYPNPFNPTSTISYALSERGPVELTVYNTLGQRVAVLASGVEDAGSHNVQFDASNLPSGVHVYTLRAEGQLLTGRLMLVK